MRVLIPSLAALSAVGWLLLARVRPDGRWRLTPVIVFVVMGLVAANEARWAAFEHRLAVAAAPVMAGRDAGFGCERLTRNFFASTGHVGHVYFDADGNPADSAFLSMNTCAQLKNWIRHPDPANLDEVVAVHTLAHEGAHLGGLRNEAQAECRALGVDEQVMVNLGADRATAAAALARYKAEVYPRLPSEYTAGGC